MPLREDNCVKKKVAKLHLERTNFCISAFSGTEVLAKFPPKVRFRSVS